MNYYRIISKRPRCITCGELMEEWNPFVKPEHQEHPECAGKRIADEIFKEIKKELGLT